MAGNLPKLDKKSVAKRGDRRLFKKGANPLKQNMYKNFDISHRLIDQPQADSDVYRQQDFYTSKTEPDNQIPTKEANTNAA